MEQTKERFVAQYYGQQIMYKHEFGTYTATVEFGDRHTIKYIDHGYLLLRNIDQLTDEEAHKLAVLAFYHPTIEDFQPDDVWTGEGGINPDGSTWLEVGCRCWQGTLKMSPTYNFSLLMEDEEKDQPVYNQLSCTDYLRSIGICLSLHAIEMGWVAIKQE